MNMTPVFFFTLNPKLRHGESQKTNGSKGQGSRMGKKGKKGEGATNKRSATKLTQGQPNTMEARFVRLEALVTSMTTKVKSNTSWSRKAKDREDDKSYGSNVNQISLCGWFFRINGIRQCYATYVKRLWVMGSR
jgi:hypothetical protein